MTQTSTSPYLFGDLLALARQSWLREQQLRLGQLGYHGYRRSDAAALRLLRRGPVPVGSLAAVLGVTRQAARKVADALVQRGYAWTERDDQDGRRLNIVLTPAGIGYADAISAVIGALNAELRARVGPVQLAAADTALRAAIWAPADRERAARLVAPPR